MPAGESLCRTPNPQCALDGYSHGLYYGTTWSSRFMMPILVICDRFTKTSPSYSYYERDEFSRLGVPLLRSCMEINMGLSNTVISDHGLQLCVRISWGNSIKNIGDRYKIINCISTPQTDRQMGENDTREVGSNIWGWFVDYCQTNWPEWLAIAEFSYNNKIQKSIKILPFYANYGFNPWMGIQAMKRGQSPGSGQILWTSLKMNSGRRPKAALHKAHDKHEAFWQTETCTPHARVQRGGSGVA